MEQLECRGAPLCLHHITWGHSKSPIPSQLPLPCWSEQFCLTQLSSALWRGDVIFPFVAELKMAPIQLRDMIKYMFLYLHWSIQSPTGVSGCLQMGTPRPPEKPLMQPSPMVQHNGCCKPLSAASFFGYSQKKEHQGSKLDVSEQFSIQQPFTRIKVAFFYAIYNKRQKENRAVLQSIN